MDAVFYWDMTYREILTAIQGNQARLRAAIETEQEKLKYQAVIAYRQSDLIAILVGRLFGTKANVPLLHEVFPGLFPELERPRQQNWQMMKARIEQYASERRKRGETGGNDTGRAASPDHSRNEGPP